MKTTLATLLLLPVSAVLAAEPLVPTFKAIDVDTKVEIGYGVTVADVNGDQKPDILLADKNLIVWYENPAWTKHVIAEKLTPHDHVCIAARDIDGDGKCEIAVGAGWNPSDTVDSGAVFYLIPPADRTQKWEPVALPHEPTVHRMRWVKNAANGFDLVMVPLHGRGNKPATGEGVGVKIIRYHKPTDPKGTWTTDVLDESLHKTHNFDPLTWAREDAPQEMLIGSKEGVFLLDPTPAKPTLTQLSGAEAGGVGEVRVGSLGKLRFFTTIEPMHGNNLVFYRPPSTPDAKGLWTRTVLDESLVDGHALAVGDFSGSKREQIVVGWRAMNKPGVKVGIKLFTALDDDGKQWKQTLIDDNTMACEDLCVADIDGDGKLDIVAAGRATKNVKVYLNQGVGQ
jgi:hypothetical protein